MRSSKVIKSVKLHPMEKIKLKFQIKMINNKWVLQVALIDAKFTPLIKFLVKITLKMMYTKVLVSLA